MVLEGNYVGRSGCFNYNAFAKAALLQLDGKSTNATLLYRTAVECGAVEKNADILLKNLRVGLSGVANQKGFNRHRLTGQKGYFFKAEK